MAYTSRLRVLTCASTRCARVDGRRPFALRRALELAELVLGEAESGRLRGPTRAASRGDLLRSGERRPGQDRADARESGDAFRLALDLSGPT